jgi:hypothetical protein
VVIPHRCEGRLVASASRFVLPRTDGRCWQVNSADLNKLPPSKESVSSPPTPKPVTMGRQVSRDCAWWFFADLDCACLQKSLSRLQNAITPKKRASAGTIDIDVAGLGELQGQRSSGLSGSSGLTSATVAALMAQADATASQITMGTAKELVEMLVEPSMSGSRFRQEFSLAMNYVIDSNALLERVWAGIEAENKQSDKWMAVLSFWVTDHFYYFSSSQVLMTSLLQRVKSKHDIFCFLFFTFF